MNTNIKIDRLLFYVAFFIVGIYSTALISCTSSAAKNKSIKSKPESSAVFKFQEEQFNFGQIHDGDTVSHQFAFTNIGKETLIINDISTSCGCTIAEWSKKPISPDSSGNITVQFSKHHDPGSHVKQIIIKANTIDPYTILHIIAFVKE